MARIISLTQSCVAGGVYRVCLLHTALLKKSGHEAYYYSIIRPPKYWDLFDRYGFEPLYTSYFKKEIFTRVFGDFLFTRDFVEKVRTSNLIIAHNNPGAKIALNFKQKFGIPFIFYLHDSLIYPLIGSFYGVLFKFNNLNKYHEKKHLLHSDLVLVNSQLTLKQVLRNHNEIIDVLTSKIKILYPTLNVPLDEKEIYGKRQKYLLIVGRIDHEAYYYLYNIIKQLNLPLIIAGYGHPHNANFKKILKLYKELELQQKVKFIFSPSDNELINLYKNAVLFLYPGHENFNMSALEAMSCGCPILVADTSGILEIIPHSLRKRVCLPKNNTDLWVKRINEIVQTKEYDELGLECWKISLKYNINTHLKRFKKLVNKFL
ncbi:MAG TPA: glycosyltransferase [Candidatus Atribacteria bacterium]|nr:glycosyltransferase [Candidatus Atribacteria bacterium]